MIRRPSIHTIRVQFSHQESFREASDARTTALPADSGQESPSNHAQKGKNKKELAGEEGFEPSVS
jgi:hypothetical protein